MELHADSVERPNEQEKMSPTSLARAEDGQVDDPLVFARLIRADGSVRAMDWPQASRWEPGPERELLWVHLDRAACGIGDWLRGRFGLSDAMVDAITSDDNRPRAFRQGEALGIILRGLNIERDADPADMVAMQIWADSTRVVTLRRRRMQTITDILAKINAEIGSITSGALVTRLVEKTVSDIGRVVQDMNEQIDRLEDRCVGQPVEDVLTAIAAIRRRCLALKRHMSPQYDALLGAVRLAPAWLSGEDRMAIRETIDQLHHYLADIDVTKESALVLQDDLNNRAAAQSNRTTYLLTIVAAVFLPLSFLTGLLGMDVGGTPGVNWHPAFSVTCCLMAVLVAVQIVLFRRLRWI